MEKRIGRLGALDSTHSQFLNNPNQILRRRKGAINFSGWTELAAKREAEGSRRHDSERNEGPSHWHDFTPLAKSEGKEKESGSSMRHKRLIRTIDLSFVIVTLCTGLYGTELSQVLI